MNFRPPLVLLVAATSYLAFRALVLHTNFDAVAIPVFELPVQGNLAHLVSTSEHGEPLARYYDNCGGHILTGLFGGALYALVGNSYLALKLVPLLLGLATLLLVWRILSEHFDRRAADLFAILFAFAPPTLTKYSLLAKGNHFENLAFQALVLLLFLGMHARGMSARRLFATGAAAGFAVFVYFGSVVLLIGLALLHVAVRGKRTLRDVPSGLGGLLVGLVPLAWVQLNAAGQPSKFLGAKLATLPAFDLGAFGARLFDLFADVLPQSAVFESVAGVPARFAEALFLGTFFAAWAWLVIDLAARARAVRNDPSPRESRERELARFTALKPLPFVLFLPLFALLISGTDFTFSYYAPPVEVGRFRYLVPHFLFALVVIAIASARLSSRRGASRLLGAGLGVAALTTGLFTMPLVVRNPSETGIGRVYTGDFFLQYANVVMRAPERDPVTRLPRWDPEPITEALDGLRPVHWREAYAGVGHYAAWAAWLGSKGAGPGDGPRISIASVLDGHPAEARVFLARGVGSALRRVLGPPKEFEELRAELERLAVEDHPFLPWVVEGLCLDPHYPLARDVLRMTLLSEDLEAATPPSLRSYIRRGRGAELGRLLARGLDSDRALARTILGRFDVDPGADFWFGLGFGAGEKARRHDRLFEGFDLLVPPEHRTRVLEGHGAYLRELFGPDPPLPKLRVASEQRAALMRGSRWPNHPAPYSR